MSVVAEEVHLDKEAEREGLSVVDQIAPQDAEQRRAIAARMVQTFLGECPANGGMTTQGVRSVGSIADRGNGDAMGVAVDYDGG